MHLYLFRAAITLAVMISTTAGRELTRGQQEEYEKAAKVIKSSFPTKAHDNTAANTCDMTTGDSCDITNMPQDTTTLVSPGGMTRCIFSGSTPYSFQVIPGDTSKVLVYFQGGGACWDKFSTATGMW